VGADGGEAVGVLSAGGGAIRPAGARRCSGGKLAAAGADRIEVPKGAATIGAVAGGLHCYT
jgi:hypothetical protein